MSAVPEPRIKTALLCDDVRREITGKDIIIGVYGDDIVVPSFPIALMVALYMRVQFPEPETTYAFEFRVVGNAGQTLVQPAKTTVDSQATEKTTTMAMTGILIQIQSAGRISFQWRLPKNDWQTILGLDVVQGNPLVPGIPPAVGIMTPST